MAEGDFFPGDLLAAVLRLPSSFWRDHRDLHRRMAEVVERVDAEAAGLTKDVEMFRSVA